MLRPPALRFAPLFLRRRVFARSGALVRLVPAPSLLSPSVATLACFRALSVVPPSPRADRFQPLRFASLFGLGSPCRLCVLPRFPRFARGRSSRPQGRPSFPSSALPLRSATPRPCSATLRRPILATQRLLSRPLSRPPACGWVCLRFAPPSPPARRAVYFLTATRISLFF